MIRLLKRVIYGLFGKCVHGLFDVILNWYMRVCGAEVSKDNPAVFINF